MAGNAQVLLPYWIFQPVKSAASGRVIGQNLADDGRTRQQSPIFERFDPQSGMPRIPDGKPAFSKKIFWFLKRGASLLMGHAKFPLIEFLKVRPGSMDANYGLSGKARRIV
jgi:hypothetical protein